MTEIQLGDLVVYDVKQLSDLFEIQERTLRQYLREGKLQGRKMGRKWYVTEESLQDYFGQGVWAAVYEARDGSRATGERTIARPLLRTFRVTSDFQGHLNRTPPSTAPGVDWAAPRMTPVHAAAAGRVNASRFRTGGGRSMWINHGGGLWTYYAHLKWTCVLGFEDVEQGQMIGFVGSTGRSTGPHLHFSVKLDQEWMDPLPLLMDSPE
jgi:murein DD-endopeptidase MepM/ murein hydrolase activator NlpD